MKEEMKVNWEKKSKIKGNPPFFKSIFLSLIKKVHRVHENIV